MDPTEEQLQASRTINDVAAWTELPGEVGEPTSPKARLFSLLGTTGKQHARVIGAMPATDYAALIELWTYGEPAAPPTPVCKVQAGLVGRVARILCGTEQTQAQEKAAREAANAAAAAAASALASGTGTTISSGSSRENQDGYHHQPNQ